MRTGDGVVVELKSDRPISVRAFTLPDPRRLVLDLNGVINHVDRHLMPVNSPLVSQVRVAQFQATPNPVPTRVVIDLARKPITPSMRPLPVRSVSGRNRWRGSASGDHGVDARWRPRAPSRSPFDASAASEPEPAQEVVSALFDLPESSRSKAEVVDSPATTRSAAHGLRTDSQLIEQAEAVTVSRRTDDRSRRFCAYRGRHRGAAVHR